MGGRSNLSLLPHRVLSTKVVIYKYSACAGDCWEAFRTEEDQTLYQCQIRHDVARSITYQFRDKWADYIRSCPDTPDTLAELQDECGIRLVVGDKNDPEEP